MTTPIMTSKRIRKTSLQYNFQLPYFDPLRKFHSSKCNVISTSFVVIQLLAYLVIFISCQQHRQQQNIHKPLVAKGFNTSESELGVRTKRWLDARSLKEDNSKNSQNSALTQSQSASQSNRQQSWQSSQIPAANTNSEASFQGRVVVYQVRFIATKTGRTDYALAGESIELSCHYMMKDEDEDVKQLIWSKDGENFLRWRKNRPGLEVLSYTFKGHIDPTSTRTRIIIHNTTIEMHGKYKCLIKTDLGQHEMDQDVVVISRAGCKYNDWRIVSQPSECRELFRLDCRNMFPKPVPSCGLWNGKLDKFIRSVAVDISEEPNKLTYRVRYSDKFELKQWLPPGGASGSDKNLFSPTQNNATQTNNNNNNNNTYYKNLNLDLLQYAGHLVFKCDIIVPETSWKLSISHKMFDFNDGCLQDPLETIERMRVNYGHYAAARIQEAGYLIDRQLNEFEMLTSNLKYELLPPPRVASEVFATSTTSNNRQVELNCWQKPRFGSLARLSCASTQTNQVKLLGANLLECQSTGNWVPISGSQLDHSRLNKINKSAMRQRELDVIRLNKRREITNSTSLTKLPTVATPNDLAQHNKTTFLNNSTTQTTTTTKMFINQVSSVKQQQQQQAREISSLSSSNKEDNDYISANEYSLSPADTNDLEEYSTIPSTSLPNVDSIPTTEINLEPTARTPLDPSQLAHLLPTCVSTRPARPRAKLPLRILESSLQNRQHPSKGQNNNLPGRHQDSLFNFSSSANSNTFLPASSVLFIHSHSVLLIVMLLLTSISLSNLHGQLSKHQFRFVCK